ncbi:unnamed protein product [Brassica rapa]|uniref:Uncharacterized protein n=1 Tax=Brassica campestris TaxID=3711 RepID=A0A8D9H6S7_BRACM|nr:unnamed protein product [Brassica rapa]
MCKFSLYVKTKILIRLNIFDQEDFWKTYEILMENLCKTHGRLMEDFDLDFWKTYGRLLEDLWKTLRRLMED